MKQLCALKKNKRELTSLSLTIDYLIVVNNLTLMCLWVFLSIILTACRGVNEYDSDKQYALLVQFPTGMSKEEVDAILQNYQDITLLEEFQENGELVVRYSTPIEIYGSNILTFRYSVEMKLIYVIPVEPTD